MLHHPALVYERTSLFDTNTNMLLLLKNMVLIFIFIYLSPGEQIHGGVTY